MGWHVTDFENADWASVVNVQDFQKAHIERTRANGGARADWRDLVAAGDDVQRGYWPGGFTGENVGWAQIQIYIIGCSFVQSHNLDGTYRGDDYYSGTPGRIASVEYWTFAKICQAIGLSSACWRRATAMPADWTDPDDPAYIGPTGSNPHGVMEPGDIIGPWIFTDLQHALNCLLWTQADLADGQPTTYVDSAHRGPDSYTEDSTWSAAESGAENAFTGSSWTTGSGGFSPQGWCDSYGSDPYGCQFYRSRYKLSWLIPGAGIWSANGFDYLPYLTCQVDSFVRAGKYLGHGEFDNTGVSGYIVEDTWKLFETTSDICWHNGDGSHPIKIKTDNAVGDTSTTPAATLSPDDSGYRSPKGWEIQMPLNIVRWNVENGFDYTGEIQ